MKKLLIVGAGVDQLPAIKIAKKWGHYVISTDYNPKSIGYKYSDNHHVVSTNDYKGTLNVAKKEKIDGIMTLISETAVPVISNIARELNLPCYSPETALAATNKIQMHKVMEAKNIRMPKSVFLSTYVEAEEAVCSFNYPIVIKPSNSSGQRGLKIIHSSNNNVLRDAFIEAKKYASDENVLIEEYIQGPEINVCTVVINKKVHTLSLSNRVTLKNPHFGIAIHHICEPTLPNKELECVSELAIKATEALEMVDGITYPQIIVNNGVPYLIEIAVRIPGGNMREIAMYKSGVDMVKVAIKQALGEVFLYDDMVTERSYNGVVVKHITDLNLKDFNFKIESLSGINEAKNQPYVKKCSFRYGIGDEIPKLNWSGGRFGVIITVSNSNKDAYERAQSVFDNLKINGLGLKEYDSDLIQNFDEIYTPIMNNYH